MLFDVDIFELIEQGKFIVRGKEGEILDKEFLQKYEMIQTGSLDVRLNTVFAIHKHNLACYKKSGKCNDQIVISSEIIDPLEIVADDYEIMEIDIGSKFIMPPLSFCLAGTMEAVELPNNICYVVDGKSTMGRLGITVHVTAGYADAGFKKQITLEMFNANHFSIILRPGMFVGQYRFFKSESGRDAINPYSGNYFEQVATQTPKTKKLFRYLNGIGKV